MDRVFLDASVLFLASYRADAALAQLWHEDDVRLLTSSYPLQEIWRNAIEPEQRLRLAVMIPQMELVAELAADESSARSAGLPPKDVPILHSAISGGATHLLTADLRHFGPLFGATVGGVLIQLPAQYFSDRRARKK